MQHNLISFPRSGQYMNERLLNEFYDKYKIPYKYCEFYKCCNTTPCKIKSTYQKNHDFNLDLTIKVNEKYLFLYRKDKLEQLEAFYRYTKSGKQNYKDIKDYVNLLLFCKKQSKYYDNLVNKYVNSNKENILPIDYNDYVNNPKETFHNIISFFGLNYTFEQVSEFIDNREIKISKRYNLDNDFRKKILEDLEKKNIKL